MFADYKKTNGGNMPKFFASKDRIKDNEIILDEESSKHLIKVLRYKVGDKIDVCDGENTDYHCTIASSDNVIKLKIESSEKAKSEVIIADRLFSSVQVQALIDLYCK